MTPKNAGEIKKVSTPGATSIEQVSRLLQQPSDRFIKTLIYVADGNYGNRGELYLAHKHNGLDIEIKYAVETLKNLYKIWQRPVHLQAQIDDEMILFTYDGHQPKQQAIHDEAVNRCSTLLRK